MLTSFQLNNLISNIHDFRSFYDHNSTKQAAFVLSLLLDLCKQYNRLDKFLAWGWYGMGDNFYQTDNNTLQEDRDQWYGLIQM